ncbi:hypothetical protein BDC45DRAFT_514037 [Circinella umbellata]|nr:hypothetical protein BDC45DRAFT_514037 [Circinella umbellata]
MYSITKFFVLLLLLTCFIEIIIAQSGIGSSSVNELLPSTQIATETPTPTSIYGSSAPESLNSLVFSSTLLITITSTFYFIPA